ncbi:MAG: class I SAM-dependent methyltransferase [Candidatus Wildermuthbacteria bacterium]|nr:class I SAM-dependent methyltransferase [Candidatus Wildermuthbacteria bacterium]
MMDVRKIILIERREKMVVARASYHYEPFADTAEYRDVNAAAVRRWLEVMRDNGIGRIERLLDLATGVGTMAKLFIDYLPAHSRQPTVICVDKSEEALEQAKVRLAPVVADLNMIHAAVEEMDLPDESVDVAVWGNGIHYLSAEDQEKALRRIKRVLRPEGWFCVNTAFHAEGRPSETVPFYRAQVKKAVEHLRSRGINRQDRSKRPEASNYFSQAQYEELIRAAGLRIENAHEFSIRVRVHALRCISGFVQYASGALHGYTPEAAVEAMQNAVEPALQEYGQRDEQNKPYVTRNWLAIIARKEIMTSTGAA